MINKVLSRCAPVLMIAVVAGLGFADEPQQKQSPKSPSIEGTYKLVSRKLSDGTTLSGSDIVGLLTYTKTHRNFNIAWKDNAGKHKSFSVVSTYQLSAKEYTETTLLIISNDEIDGAGINYTMTGSTQTVPVTMNAGRIAFKMPFDPVSAVFEGNAFTGTNQGVFVDSWIKVD